MKITNVAQASIDSFNSIRPHCTLVACDVWDGEITNVFLAEVRFSDNILIEDHERRTAWVRSPDRRNNEWVEYARQDDGTWCNAAAKSITLHPRV